jgi:hypothetical protein
MYVGYLFVDIPGWARHQLGTNFLGLEGLEGSERDVKVGDVVREYCKTTCEAVKTVDQNHLILGDRFMGIRAFQIEFLML